MNASKARRLGACIALVLGMLSVRSLAAAHPSFEGVWSGVFTTQNNEFWQIEDFGCFAGCTPGSYAYLKKLLDDPANDDKSSQALMGLSYAFMRKELAGKSTPAGLALQKKNTPKNDPTLLCKPYGLVREAVDPLPISIHREGSKLVIDYEEWNETRTIHMDGRRPPPSAKATSLGHSVGHYEGDTLVVETTNISPDIYFSFESGGAYSAQTHVVERYSILDDPRRLSLEMTVTDPVTLREPQVIIKTWLWTPDVKLVKDRCKDVPGKF